MHVADQDLLLSTPYVLEPARSQNTSWSSGISPKHSPIWSQNKTNQRKYVLEAGGQRDSIGVRSIPCRGARSNMEPHGPPSIIMCHLEGISENHQDNSNNLHITKPKNLQALTLNYRPKCHSKQILVLLSMLENSKILPQNLLAKTCHILPYIP